MAQLIQLKYETGNSTDIPINDDIQRGELIINTQAGNIWYGDNSGNIAQFKITTLDATPWRIFSSDINGNVDEIALGGDGQVLTSTGTTSAPAFEDAGTSGSYSGSSPGLVPIRAAGNTTSKYLNEAGSWAVPPDSDNNTTYSAGTGLSLSTTTFSVNAAQTQITTIGALAQTLLPAADDTYDLGSTSAAWQDLHLEGNINSTDAMSINSAAGDISLVPAENVTVYDDSRIEFRDSALYIGSSTDGQLDIVADTEVQMAATTIDINGAVDISGTLTMGDHLYIPDMLVHSGDSNTRMRFPSTDTITFETAGTERLRIASDGEITADAGFTTTGTWTFDEYTSGTIGITTVQDSGTTFNDNDTSLMTAAAINDRIGDISGGGESNQNAWSTIIVPSGTTSQAASSTTDTITFTAAGGMTITGGSDTIEFSSANTNTTYSAGSLLDLSSTTFNVDLSELTDGTSDINSSDEVVYLDNGSQKRKAFSELKLSEFNNDSGWTTNTGTTTASNSQTFTNKGGNISQWTNNSGYTTNSGTVTSVAVTTAAGLDGATTITSSGTVALSLDLSELSDGTSDIDSNDEVIYLDNGTEKRKAFSELKLSEFNNDSGWTSNNGDITGVTAGSGMSGGGSSGSVTLTNAGVTSIVAGSGISISGATGAVTVTASGGGGGGLDVSGTDNRLVRMHSTDDIQDSGITIDDSDNISGIGTLSSGAITCTTIDSGNGATEIYDMNQDIRTDDDVSFTRVQVTGTGAIDLNNGYIQIKGDEGTDGRLMIFADEGDNNPDKWEVQATTGGLFEVTSKNTGSYVPMMSITNAAQMTLGTINSQNGRYQIASGANVLNGITGTFDIPTDFMYDAMSGAVMVVGAQTITVTGGIITSLG